MEGRGSENKLSIAAAPSHSKAGDQIHVAIPPVCGFTSEGIGSWERQNLASTSRVLTGGLVGFRSAITAGCEHEPMATSGKRPKDLPGFHWINTVLSNLRTSLNGTFHAFKFEKYGNRYVCGLCFRFNRRFNLAQMTKCLLNAASCCGARRERLLRPERVSA